MNDPISPLTELAAIATQLHEMYQSLVDAGFTEHQALQLVSAAMTSGGQETA